MPSVFYVGGDLSCKQASASVPGIVTVTTKEELSRNKANFRNNDELLAEIKEKICIAAETKLNLKKFTFPLVFEKSFKRVEDAERFLARLHNRGIVADYLTDEILGKDAHMVVSTVHNIGEFIAAI